MAPYGDSKAAITFIFIVVRGVEFHSHPTHADTLFSKKITIIL